jgi:hypothetical protein
VESSTEKEKALRKRFEKTVSKLRQSELDCKRAEALFKKVELESKKKDEKIKKLETQNLKIIDEKNSLQAEIQRLTEMLRKFSGGSNNPPK